MSNEFHSYIALGKIVYRKKITYPVYFLWEIFFFLLYLYIKTNGTTVVKLAHENLWSPYIILLFKNPFNCRYTSNATTSDPVHTCALNVPRLSSLLTIWKYMAEFTPVKNRTCVNCARWRTDIRVIWCGIAD